VALSFPGAGALLFVRSSFYSEHTVSGAAERTADRPARAAVPPARRPVLTAGVLVVTAAISVAGLLAPPLVEALRRDGAALSDGHLWRLVTALLVQDGSRHRSTVVGRVVGDR